jgi:hypothetical protein
MPRAGRSPAAEREEGATARELTVHGSRVKVRSPWSVFFLSLGTLGISYLVWY